MTSIAAIRTHFSRWREWEPNPIVLKELRQSVRSLTVPGVVILFLVVLFFTNLAFPSAKAPISPMCRNLAGRSSRPSS